MTMPDRLLGCLPLAFRIAIVGIGIWLVRRRTRPPEPPPPEDGVQPVDVYAERLIRDQPSWNSRTTGPYRPFR